MVDVVFLIEKTSYLSIRSRIMLRITALLITE